MFMSGKRIRHLHQQQFQLLKRCNSFLILPFWLLEMGVSVFLHHPWWGFLMKIVQLPIENRDTLKYHLSENKIISWPYKSTCEITDKENLYFQTNWTKSLFIPCMPAAISLQNTVISSSSSCHDSPLWMILPLTANQEVVWTAYFPAAMNSGSSFCRFVFVSYLPPT